MSEYREKPGMTDLDNSMLTSVSTSWIFGWKV